MDKRTYIIALTVAGPEGLAILERLLEAPGLEAGTCWRRTGRPRLPPLPHHRRTRGGTQADARRIADLTEVVQGANLEKARYLRQASHQIKSPLSSIQSYINVILEGYTGEIPDSTRKVVEKIHARMRGGARGARQATSARRPALRGPGRARRRDLRSRRSGRAGGGAQRRARLRPRRHRSPCWSTTGRTRRGVTSRSWSPCSPSSSRTPSSTPTRVGCVEVDVVAAQDAELAVSVRDHGIGIPERSLSRVFAEDYRSDPAVKKYPDGVGTRSGHRPGDRRPLRALRLVRERGGTRQRVHGPRATGARLTDRALREHRPHIPVRCSIAAAA